MILQIASMFAIYLAPPVLLTVYKIRDLNRRITQAEGSQLPFEPIAAPARPVPLRRLAAPEQVYLMQQLKLAAAFYLLMSWTELFILTLPLFKPVPSANQWFDPSAYTWFIFLRNATTSEKFFFTSLFFCAAIVIVPFRAGVPAIFHRTRPLTLSFLFWARVLPFTVALTAAMATGIVLALLVLLGVEGRIWEHLPAAIPRVLGLHDAELAQAYVDLLRSSPRRIFMSMVTTVPLVFTALVAVFAIPLGRWYSRSMLPIYLVLLMSIGLVGPALLADFADDFHAPRILFLYASLGPPPAYGFIAGPILFSIGFLLLARVFVNRIEI